MIWVLSSFIQILSNNEECDAFVNCKDGTNVSRVSLILSHIIAIAYINYKSYFDILTFMFILIWSLSFQTLYILFYLSEYSRNSTVSIKRDVWTSYQLNYLARYQKLWISRFLHLIWNVSVLWYEILILTCSICFNNFTSFSAHPFIGV